MAIEIERKFLVKNNGFKNESVREMRITQKYLSSVPERTVRIRIIGDIGNITIKGISSVSGTSRFEWEREISVKDAKELFKICEEGIIDKIRYNVKYDKHTFEIDEFYGENEGLVIAEIELAAEEESFIRPDWLGTEVTGDKKYYNSVLIKNPFCIWNNSNK